MTGRRLEEGPNEIKGDFDSKRLVDLTFYSCLMFMKFLFGDLASGHGPQVTRRLIIEGIKVEL